MKYFIIFLQIFFIILIFGKVFGQFFNIDAKWSDHRDSLSDILENEFSYSENELKDKPNIIMIVADDLGFNDVSFRGQNFILTPNIDALAYHGTILNKYYVPSMCSPSRTALLTGKYPIRTGMQHFVIPNAEPWGLCANEKLMSHIFQEAGYSTNLIGKWHLGFFKESYTPTFRGFDNHYGYMGGYIDYWDHSLIMLDTNFSRGHDFWKNTKQTYDKIGTYATDVITDEAVRVILNHNVEDKPLFMITNHLAPHTANENDPMQAPQHEIDKFTHISDLKKRTYAAMISKMDESIGKILQALKDKNMLRNSIIIYYSDNGAPTVGLHSNSGSNYPLRGQKNSPWEGGIRSSGVIWSPLLKKQSFIWDEPIHAVDWLPTLLAATGISLPPGYQIDGRNLWNVLSRGLPIEERSILHNIDEVDNYVSYMRGSYKYVNGTTVNGIFDNWLSESEAEIDPRALHYVETIKRTPTWKILQNFNKNLISSFKIERLRSELSVKCSNLDENFENNVFKCEPLKEPCLFNLDLDPCEKYNLAKIPHFEWILTCMERDVEEWRKKLIPSIRQAYYDPESNPALHNGEWIWWKNQSDGNAIPGTYCH